LREIRQRLTTELTRGTWSAVALARALFEGLEEVASDVPGQRQAALWLIRTAVELFRDGLRQIALSTPGDAAAPWLTRGREQPTEALEALGEAIDRCLQAEADIDQNAGVALCLEAWLLDLSHMPLLVG
jgi:hypothetical protein